MKHEHRVGNPASKWRGTSFHRTSRHTSAPFRTARIFAGLLAGTRFGVLSGLLVGTRFGVRSGLLVGTRFGVRSGLLVGTRFDVRSGLHLPAP